MAHDLLHGPTSRNWSRNAVVAGLGDSSLGAKSAKDASGYVPERWWTAKQVEEKTKDFEKSGGLFGTKLPREFAEKKTLEFLRAQNIGIMSGTMGSWILSDKDQKRILNKVDDVRFDLRLASSRVSMAGGLLAGAIGLLGLASLYRTSQFSRTQ